MRKMTIEDMEHINENFEERLKAARQSALNNEQARYRRLRAALGEKFEKHKAEIDDLKALGFVDNDIYAALGLPSTLNLIKKDRGY